VFRPLAGDGFSRSAHSKHGSLRSSDAKSFPLIIASHFGHILKHVESQQKTLGEQLTLGKITKEECDKALPELMTRVSEEILSDLFGRRKLYDISPSQISAAVEDARRSTLDAKGQCKETRLTPVYRMMLANWITIEGMTGPKELTHFLLPALGDKDFFVAYKRVKTICSRLRVRFRPRVKDI
jgi:hypothetical protein